MNEPLILPYRTLLVLCGPAGCGKSTFAAQRFPETNIVSSDRCRGIICDDENSQTVNREAFELFHYILQKRMLLGRFCVADSVALLPYARENIHQIARQHGYFSCLLIFDIPPEICIQHNSQRSRHVNESVIRYHASLLPQALKDVPQEHWDLVQVLHADTPELEIVLES